MREKRRRERLRQLIAASLAISMIAGTTTPVMADTGNDTNDAVVEADAGWKAPQSTLVLNGLFDVKNLEAGSSKYLYINTYPEEGTEITEVTSSDEGIVAVSHGNNSPGAGADDESPNNSNYNYVKLDAIKAGTATVTVTVKDTNGGNTTSESFEVQVISPEYEGTERLVTDLSEDWSFRLERDMDEKPADGSVPTVDDGWEKVSIPHCWNAEDGADGGGNYHKGTGWYVKTFPAGELSEEIYGTKQLYLELGAACKNSEIYVNGEQVARHEGGYSRIRADLTDAIKLGEENTIAISVDNNVNKLTPMSGDFTVFGGLYRDISLIATGDLHMDLDQGTSFGGRGLYVTQQGTQNVTKDTTIEDVFGDGGHLEVVGAVKNSSDETECVSAEATVYDADWAEVANISFDPVEVEAGDVHQFEQEVVVADPILWDGVENPYQYNVVFEVKDEEGTIIDRERDRIGFRFYCADPEEGFFLNGRSYLLRGVNSHQDRYQKGYAASHQDREQDMALIDNMGANAIRFAHYQHDPYVYELAAERGITVWAEIPMVNSIVNSWEFYDSTVNNMKELIYQAYNIPSVLMWGIHNEQWPTNAGLTVLLDKLYKTCKEEDPSRLVTLASAQEPGDNVDESKWDTIPLSWQSDVSAWNKYFGIYQGKDVRHFGNWINQVHDYGKKHKTIYGREATIKDPDGKTQNIPVKVHGNVGMSEYGADCSPFTHEEEPGYWAGSQSEEFSTQWHEIYYKAIDEAKWMWGSYIWNMFEFGSDSRTTTPDRLGINTKGVVTYDRTIKKDMFYFYRANWSDDPTLQITSERFKERYQSEIKVKAYSNLEQVELFVNGISQGILRKNENQEPELNNEGKPDDTLVANTQMGKFVWDVKLVPGENMVVAVGTDADGKVYTDTVKWTYKLYSKPEISSTKYQVNTANLTISGIPGGTRAREVLENIKPLYHSTFALYTQDGALVEDPKTPVTLGMKIRVTAEDGVTIADYLVSSAPVSQGKTTTASANQSGYPSKNAVDGDSTTRWGSGGSFPGWIQVDLGQAYTLSKLDTLWFASSGRKYNFDVEGSLDGVTYMTLLAASDSEQGKEEPTWTPREFADDTIARYLKINVYKNSVNSGSPSIYEIQAIGFALNSDTLSVDNVGRAIAGLDAKMTAEELIKALSVDGDYNSLTVVRDGEPVDDEKLVTDDMILVVNYGEDRQAEYRLVFDGPDQRPISLGKEATALAIRVGDKEIPNEDSGDGCSLNRDKDAASNINDGDMSTRWTGALAGSGHTIPANSYPAEVLIDLEEEYELNQLALSLYDPSTRIYRFAVYAGNDPETLKNGEHLILDMRDNKAFGKGTKEVSGRGRYVLLSVEGCTNASAYRAASVYELSVFGYRFGDSDYLVDRENRVISEVEAQSTVETFLKSLNLSGNYSAQVVLGDRVLDDESRVTEGAKLCLSNLGGGQTVEYAITFAEDEAENVPVSEGMEVSAHDVETDEGVVPNEDASKGDYASNINDGDLNTRWTGAFDSAHSKCYYPASVTISMTDPKSTDDYYYLTGVKIKFYEGSDKRYYGYSITADNIVGIPTGFVVDAQNNTTSGWVEHWTENGTNEIKNLTLNVQKCSNKQSYAAASAHELQVFAWRIKGHEYPIDEGNKTIAIGTEAVTVAEVRNSLEILGNCKVEFTDANGNRLDWADAFTDGSKLVVTDVKDHTFVYTAKQDHQEIEDPNYNTTSIEVTRKPDQRDYLVDDVFNPKGMKVVAHQSAAEQIVASSSNAQMADERTATSSNAQRVVELDLDELEFEYDFSEPGETQVTVIYTDCNAQQEEEQFTAQIDVVVADAIIDENAFYYTTAIKVKKQPDKRTYEVGDTFEPEGMQVYVRQKASPSEATREVEIDLDELDFQYDFTKPGRKQVQIIYYGLDKNEEERKYKAHVSVSVRSSANNDSEEADGNTGSSSVTASVSGTWSRDERGWRYQYSDGSYATNRWERIKNEWYYFLPSGYMATEWLHTNNQWYYLNPQSGAMRSGWLLDPTDGFWYYFSPSDGAMRSGWQQVAGQWYYLNPTATEASWYYDMTSGHWVYEKKSLIPYGAMYQNTATSDGYFVDENGAWKP